MITKDKVKIHHQGEHKLFFNTERTLRWMSWYQGRSQQNQHPELYAYEQELAHRAQQKPKYQLLAKAIKLFS